MTEADLTSQLLTTTGMVFNITSVVFGIISAYVVGLYLFLHKCNWLLKLVAFLTLTLALSVLGVAVFGISRHAEGITRALQDLDTLSVLGAMAIEPAAASVSQFIMGGVSLLGLIVYLGLAYLTFAKQWVQVDTAD